MQIECMNLRSGLTIVDIKQHHLQFQPIPGSLNGEITSSVCDVADEEDIKYLLDKKGTFRQYDQEKSYRDLLARRKEMESKAGRFNGFSIEKLVIGGLDRGYMLVDYRTTSPKFCGQDGKWTQNYQEVQAFKDQGSASDYLGHMMPGESKDSGNYLCKIKGCDRKFKSAIDLSEHVKQDHKKDEA